MLDVGCGPGQLTSQLAEDVEVVGCDVSPQMLAGAREARPGGRYELHDLHDPVPADWGRFDVVLAVGCLEFCRDLDATLGHLAAVCAPVARVLVGAVEDRALGPGASTREFSAEGLPGVAMHAYDATAQLAAVTASGLAPYGYRYVPAWRHESTGTSCTTGCGSCGGTADDRQSPRPSTAGSFLRSTVLS